MKLNDSQELETKLRLKLDTLTDMRSLMDTLEDNPKLLWAQEIRNTYPVD